MFTILEPEKHKNFVRVTEEPNYGLTEKRFNISLLHDRYTMEGMYLSLVFVITYIIPAGFKVVKYYGQINLKVESQLGDPSLNRFQMELLIDTTLLTAVTRFIEKSTVALAGSGLIAELPDLLTDSEFLLVKENLLKSMGMY